MSHRGGQAAARAHAQATGLDGSQPLFGHDATQPRRNAATHRKESGNPLTLEAGERVAKGRERGLVQPLNVVYREAQRTVVGQHDQHSEERGGHGTLIGVDVRLAKQQSGLERPPPDRRQCGQDVAGGIAEEISQPSKRKPGLGFGGPARHDLITPGGRRVDAGQPQRGLADAGLAR